MPISYRRIGVGDAALLSTVADGVFDEPIDPGRLKTYLATAENLMVLAFDGEARRGAMRWCAASPSRQGH
ncbi:hypothetical protein PSQ19_13350 [Devosia algicola]|uniref:GNAT family N-acetyltransferase n=1 Tax=Devosia algicola TaxID=3026418 RepID=A0ABY7YKM7_9HYPH|nr:hypothetical protein [Devosia algicola]WDR01723.1 hypothetical protein PSQ19_13350 [Devosia algicola]